MAINWTDAQIEEIIKKVVADNELLLISKEHTKIEEF